MKYVLALFGICLLLTLIWFQKGEIIGGGDAGLNFYSPSISVNLSKTAWVEYATGAPTLGWLPNANALYFFSILEKVGIPNFILQGSSFFLIMSLGTVSFYLLCFFFLMVRKKAG